LVKHHLERKTFSTFLYVLKFFLKIYFGNIIPNSNLYYLPSIAFRGNWYFEIFEQLANIFICLFRPNMKLWN